MVDSGFETLSGQTKYYELSICCFFANHVTLKVRATTGLLRIRLMRPSGATCLLAGFYLTEQALLKSKSACWSSTKWSSSSSSHWKTTCSHHYIAEKLLTWCQTQSLSRLLILRIQLNHLCQGKMDHIDPSKSSYNFDDFHISHIEL